MIYKQRPDATACAEYDLWNKTMRRYVRRGSKGIALVDNTGSRPKLRYVFDVSDTGARENSRPVNFWSMREEYVPAVQDALERAYGVGAGAGLEEQSGAIAAHLADEYWEANKRNILGIVDDSFLYGYDEFNVGVSFRRAGRPASSICSAPATWRTRRAVLSRKISWMCSTSIPRRRPMCWVRRSARRPPRCSVRSSGRSAPTRGQNRQGVSEEFTSEWQAEDYLLQVKEDVARREAADWLKTEEAKLPPLKYGIGDPFTLYSEEGEKESVLTGVTDGDVFYVYPDEPGRDQVFMDREMFEHSLRTGRIRDAQPKEAVQTVASYLNGDEAIVIQQYPNGQFYNHYGYNEQGRSAMATAGGFASLEGKAREGAGEDIPPAALGTDAKSTAAPQEPAYQVGDTVYLEDTLYIVEGIGLFDVQLRDPAQFYPILRSESKERLERMLWADERNAHLFAPEVSAEQDDPRGNSKYFRYFYDYETAQVEAFMAEHPDYHRIWGSDGQGLNGCTWVVYRKQPAARNFRITDDHLGEGGLKAKFETAGTPPDAGALHAPHHRQTGVQPLRLFMLVILACGIYQVCVWDWLNAAILFGVEAVCVAIQFSAMFLVELAGEWAGNLGAFLHS